MAITTIQLKRGLAANLPVLQVAEQAFTTDTKQLFIGTAEGNVRVGLFADIEASLVAAKAYTDSEVGKLDTKVQGDIADAIAAIPAVEKVTAEKDGVMSKEDKVIIDRLVGKEQAWDGKETVEGSQAKATQALNNAKVYTDAKITDLVGSAPETLDTIHELAAAIQNLEEEDVNGLIASLAGKADKEHTHAATEVIEDATHRFVTDAEKAAWNGKAVQADIDGAVNTAKQELQGNVDALELRIEELEAVTVIDGGTF